MDGGALAGFEGDQSQQGQGLAYVLPQSRSVGYVMQLANEQAQQRRDDATALAARQQKANEQYASDFYNYHTPKVAEAYSKYMQPKLDSYLKDAADFNTKTGGDYFRTPAGVQRRNDIETEANATQERQKLVTALATHIADKSKNFTPESKQAGIDYLNGYTNDPVGYLHKESPILEERNLNMLDAHKAAGQGESKQTYLNGYKITDANSTANAAKSRFTLSQPEYGPVLETQYGVNQHVGDVFQLPDGSRPTDADHLNALANYMLQNAGQPHFANTLKAMNIDPADPHAKDKLVEFAQRQNTGLNRAYGDLTTALNSDVSPKKDRDTSEERLAISEANLANSNTRLAMAQQRQADKTAPTYVQTLAEKNRNNILSQFTNGPKSITNPFPELTELYANNAKYLRAIKPVVNNDGTITVNVPAEYKYDATATKAGIPNSGRVKVKEGYPVILDPNDPEKFKNTFGQLFDQATGEKTGQPSKINTLGGKGHVQPTANKNKKSASDYGL